METISQPPIYGVFLRWPGNGKDWIHPEDVEKADRLIPSERVFRREWDGGQYSLLIYGDVRIRVRPTMWLVVEPDGFEVDQEVEIRSLLGKNLPGLAVIREMYWDPHESRVRYELEQREMRLPKLFYAEDLQPVEFLKPADPSRHSPRPS